MMEKTASETGSACSRGSGSDSGDDHASVAERAQKRRVMIIAAAAVAFVYVVSRQISKRQKKKAVRMARLRVQTNVFDWERHMGEITNGDFRQMYRLTWDAFKKLLALLKPELEPIDQTRASNAKYGERVLPETKLAITLRYLAGSSIHDLKMLFKTSISTLYDWICGLRSAPSTHTRSCRFPSPSPTRCRGRMPTPMSTTPSSCGDSWNWSPSSDRTRRRPKPTSAGMGRCRHALLTYYHCAQPCCQVWLHSHQRPSACVRFRWARSMALSSR